MPATRPRSGSSANAPSAKKIKTAHSTDPDPDDTSFTAYFASGVLNETSVEHLKTSYRQSGPFLHTAVDKLFQDDLLVKVKDECIGELSFTEKETDIYKVHQTGDLASLSYLAEAQIALLPNLLKLRDALYSPAFRSFLRKVTGCGPLSGSKQDMAVNSYKKGCHLLNHDDVIGTRRVSYILYMPMHQSEEWKADSIPVKLGPDGTEEPETMPSKTIPPSWNQFVFFEVQPGHSFHSVEEVTVDEGDCQRQRLSISGWFHKAQEGEEGYEGEHVEKNKSSLEQLRFVEESSLELHKFLREPLASKLEAGLRARDRRDGLDHASRAGRVPPHTSGVEKDDKDAWQLRGPPHKARYCSLRSPSSPSTSTNDADALAILSSPDSTPEQILQLLPLKYAVETRRFRPGLDYTLATSNNEQSILDVVLGLTSEPEIIKRKGKEESEGKGKGKAKAKKHVEDEEDEEPAGWGRGEWGGWECYMAPHEGDEDPAVYRSGSNKKKAVPEPEHKPEETHKHKQNGGNGAASSSSGSKKPDADSANGDEGTDNDADADGDADEDDGEDEDMPSFSGADEEDDEDDEDEDDSDGTLLTVQPGFNRLMLALRDEGVMRFVKYVSASAPGSRWDVCGEYEVFMAEEVDEDGEGKNESEA
ncbi:Oxoglutarate and iron-dependent oxygenase degradation C-term-domain-containing protein [Phellopilus nigrolimitatus]|nr:Oxoglutarate and iron-dependent oxygenase degradation C-term-domain-containing protein [Phellopilus nigrolimitatus]